MLTVISFSLVISSQKDLKNIDYIQLPNYSVNVHKNPHLNETKTRTWKKCTAHDLAMMSFVSPLLRGG